MEPLKHAKFRKIYKTKKVNVSQINHFSELREKIQEEFIEGNTLDYADLWPYCKVPNSFR